MDSNDSPVFLRGGGEMGRYMRSHDWESTSLGIPNGWPAPLTTVIRLILNSGHPMHVWWGPDLLCFYNDAYSRSIGSERHPQSLGCPGREVWGEIWHIIGPQVEQVMCGGDPIWHENALVLITRNERREEVYWTYSYSPINDPTAQTGVGGVLVVCAETTDIIKMAQSAAADRERFRLFFEQAPSFMAILRGAEHRIELANPSYLRLIGKRDVVGRALADALPEAVDQGYLQLLDNAYATGVPYVATGAKYALYPSSSGHVEERYVDFVYQPIKDSSGFVTGIFVEGTDVTSRSLAELALHKSEEQLRLATDAAEIGLWDVELTGDTDTLYWPPRVKAMFGISADRPVSMKHDFYPCLHPEDRDRVTLAFTAALDPAKRALYDVEYRTIGKEDGVERWVAAKGRGIFDENRCLRVLGTAIDISARKTTEAELKELNDRLEQRVAVALAEKKTLVDIVESTDAQVQVIDRDLRLVAINRAAADHVEFLYGVRPRPGDHILNLRGDLTHEREIVSEYWSRALSGEKFTVVHAVNAPGAELRHYEMKFNSLRNAHGDLVGAFHFVYDITDRLRDQTRLAEAESHMRQAQKIEALGQLTGGVAHDFNNLLMVIKGGLSLLKRPTIEPDRRLRLLSGMEQAADRGSTLSRQLLAFSRRQPLKSESIDLCLQIRGMRELLDRTLRGDVKVKTQFTDDLWPVEVDPAELEFVILNLCVNARDAMPSGGVIVIAACNSPAIQQEDRSRDFVSLSVSDPGIGMSAEVLSHAFEPFYTTKEVGKGSGLGLAQVHGFARQSGGSVRIRSQEGEGTTVTLLLPRTERPPAMESPAVDWDNTVRRRALLGCILLVEDDDEVAALVAEMLKELGYQVTRVASARGALGALADDRTIDLVLSDVMMPGEMNGVALAREIKLRRSTLPVLLTTGYASDALAQTSDHPYDFRVLHKPYDIHTLDTALRAALGR